MRWIVAALTLCVGASSATAETIYKWVDEDGAVSYSTTRPSAEESVATEEVDIIGLTPEQEATAAARHQSLIERSSATGQKASESARRRSEKERQVAEARAAVRRAETALQATKSSRRNDTADREQINEDALKAAKERLRKAQAGTLPSAEESSQPVDISTL